MNSIAVIIPTYNQAAFLPHAVASALAQTAPAAEVIVVDDGSTDGTPTALAPFNGRVTIIRQPNRGVAAARNRGAAAARAELLAFLDSDDVWLPRKLERQVSRLRAVPTAGLVHCGFEFIDAAGVPTGQSCTDGLEGDVADEMLRFRRPVVLGGGSGVLVPRAAFEAVGGFDPRLSTSADWDLYYRIARRHKVAFVPEVLLRYRRHGGNMHGNVRAMEHDMLIAFAKSFRDAGPVARRFRRQCYGNLHAVLAGSFLAAGQSWAALRHAALALAKTPGALPRVLGYPLRRWARRGVGP